MNEREIRKILGRYPAGVQPVGDVVTLRGGGGLSGAWLWRFAARSGTFVLRAWPSPGTTRERVERVHRWLSQAESLPFVPVPVCDQTGGTVQEAIGSFWDLSPWLPGTADLACPPAPQHLSEAFLGLAKFHQQLASEQADAVSPGIAQRLSEIQGLIDGGFDAIEESIAESEERDDALLEIVVGWLLTARGLAPRLVAPLVQASALTGPVQPVIRDARPEHFLFNRDLLTGLVDFGAMGVDSVAADLSRLIGEWLGTDSDARQRALEAYEQVRPLGPVERTLIGAFETGTALLMGERWCRWHFVENRRFDDPGAVRKGMARGLDRVMRLEAQLGGNNSSIITR